MQVAALGATGSGRRWLFDALGLAARLLLAGVFIVFGFDKISDHAAMRTAVRAYQLVPESLIDLVASVLPPLEIVVGFLLLIGMATRISALLTALMLVAFLFGIIWAVAHGLSIDCGCSGGGGAVAAGETEYTWEILRDLGLLAAAAYLVVRPRSWLSVDGLFGRRRADAPAEVPANSSM